MRLLRKCIFAGAAITLALSSFSAQAYDTLVDKKVFELPSFTTQGGETIREVKVGWEAYGTLNAAKDNVILICHYFSGNSHAAGRYEEGGAAGYWNNIIGSGKAIDTDKYYVISVDTLVNLGTGNPMVTTTGPASVNPDTGKPYGMDFPVVTIRDFIEVQRELLDSLGIDKLHAVMGASMGSMQAYEWAASYPDRVERLIPVIGSGYATGDLIAWLNIWSAPIKLDPNWNGGDYYDGNAPMKGLAEALKIVTLHAQHYDWSNGVFGRAWADETKDPKNSFDNLYKIEAVLDAAAANRAKTSDANHFLYLAKASQLFYTGHGTDLFQGLKDIEAPTLIIHTNEDLVFPGDAVRETAALIKSDGTAVKLVEIQGTRGHLDGVLSLPQAAGDIETFLSE